MDNKIVAFDTSPLSSGHKGRGVGTYTRELMRAIKASNHKGLELVFTDTPRTVSADLIHYPYFDLFFQTLPLFKNSKTLVTVHDVIPLRYPNHFPSGIKGLIKLQLQKFALQSVDHVITDSKASKKDISKYLDYPQKKITPVLLAASDDFKPVSQKQVTSLKKKYQLPDEFFLFVGSITYNKNIPRLIQAISKLHSLPLVINTRTDLNAQIQEKQTRMILDEVNQALDKASTDLIKIVQMDSVEELNQLYNAASAYIQPSLAEGFGLPLLEAMQAETPVLAAESTSLPEVGGKACLYFDPNSVESMIKAISAFEKLDKKKKKQMIAQGKKQAQKFSWENTASQTIKLYQSVLQS